MFTITNKLRTIIAVGVASATLGASGVASAQTIDPNKVDSAGIAGFDRQRCEDVANAINLSQNEAAEADASGNEMAAGMAGLIGDQLQTTLENNCVVID